MCKPDKIEQRILMRFSALSWLVLSLFVVLSWCLLLVDRVIAAPEKAPEVGAKDASQRQSAADKTSAAKKTGASSERTASLFDIPKDDSLPIFVNSNALNLDSKKRLFTYIGNVEAKRGDMTILAEKMIGQYDQNNQLTELVAEKSVIITRGEEMRATSERAKYDVPAGTIQLTEQPELTNKGNVLSADKITLFVNEDRSDAEGNVRVRILNADDLSSAKSLQAKSTTAESAKR